MMKTKEEQIAEIEKSFAFGMSAIQERRNYRMKNYYDCVDDYSFGGLCDKADDELENRLRTTREIKIEEVMNDGKVIRQSSFYRLVSDKSKCDGAKCGRYGEYFVIDDKIVGVPKKLSTLSKKGYKLFHIKRKYECTLKEVNKHGVVWRRMNLISEEVTEVKNIPNFIGELSFIDYQFETYFN